MQLQWEFGQIQVNHSEHWLGVTTPSITLKGVYLGSFAIQLSFERLACSPDYSAFTVVALDPNQPSGDHGEVTHPHVRDATLCAGDATTPIADALFQGRFDRCLQPRQQCSAHLQPAQPLRRVRTMVRGRGEDCGSCQASEELCSCGGCNRQLCESCIRSCERCEVMLCLDASDR